MSEANVDPVLPVQEIASEIARRTGIELTDRGTVRREVHKKLRGIKASADAAAAIAESEIASLNRRHNNLMLALCSILFLLVAGGLLLDISKSNLDLGDRPHRFSTIGEARRRQRSVIRGARRYPDRSPHS